jgi:hypothetical protein
VAGTLVIIEAKGKDNTCLIGVLKVEMKGMKEKKNGVAIENGHYLGDGLWILHLDQLISPVRSSNMDYRVIANSQARIGKIDIILIDQAMEYAESHLDIGEWT